MNDEYVYRSQSQTTRVPNQSCFVPDPASQYVVDYSMLSLRFEHEERARAGWIRGTSASLSWIAEELSICFPTLWHMRSSLGIHTNWDRYISARANHHSWGRCSAYDWTPERQLFSWCCVAKKSWVCRPTRIVTRISILKVPITPKDILRVFSVQLVMAAACWNLLFRLSRYQPQIMGTGGSLVTRIAPKMVLFGPKW